MPNLQRGREHREHILDALGLDADEEQSPDDFEWYSTIAIAAAAESNVSAATVMLHALCDDGCVEVRRLSNQFQWRATGKPLPEQYTATSGTRHLSSVKRVGSGGQKYDHSPLSAALANFPATKRSLL